MVAALTTIEAEWTRLTGPDPDAWASATDAWQRLGYTLPATYTRWRYAQALLASTAPREQMAAVLTDAWQAATGMGARPLTAELEAVARRAHISLQTQGPERTGHPATPGHQFHLTAREREVLSLLMEGKTNRQVAQALYISDKTASVHVSNILSKLEVTNCGEAAAVAHRLGLTQ